RGPIAGYLSGKLDRKVAIDGDLKVRLSLQPEIEIDKLTVGNAPWGTHPSMLEIERIKFRVELAPLFQRRIVLPEVDLLRTLVALEKNADGSPNWVFHEGSSGGGWAPEIGSLTIHDSQVAYEDAPAALKTLVVLESDAQPQHGSVPTMRFAGRGTLHKEVF